jgi:hypothetical protein
MFSRDVVIRQSRDRTVVGSLGYATGRLAGTTNQEKALYDLNGHGVFTAVILDAPKGRADAETLGNTDGGSVWLSCPKTRCSACRRRRARSCPATRRRRLSISQAVIFSMSPPLSADTRFAEPMTGAEIEIAWRTLPALGHEPSAR